MWRFLPLLLNDDSDGCKNEEIPPCGRNDNAPEGCIGISGGKAAAYSPKTFKRSVIPSETECSEEPHDNSTVSVARNLLVSGTVSVMRIFLPLVGMTTVLTVRMKGFLLLGKTTAMVVRMRRFLPAVGMTAHQVGI
jgi:hypothetical protein